MVPWSTLRATKPCGFKAETYARHQGSLMRLGHAVAKTSEGCALVTSWASEVLAVLLQTNTELNPWFLRDHGIFVKPHKLEYDPYDHMISYVAVVLWSDLW